MANILFVKKVNLSTFYKRRISRILPVFLVFLSCISIVSWLFSLSNEHSNYLFNLFFIRAYWPIEPDLWNTGIPIGHLWSLNVEEHSYILLSLITVIPLFKKWPALVILFLGFSSILLQYVYIKNPDIAPQNYHLRTEVAASFLLLSSGYFLVKGNFEKFIPSWLPVLTLAFAFVCYSDFAPHWSARWTLAPFLLAFSVNHLDITPNLYKNILRFQPLRILGLWSFSIYLWQQPLYFYGTHGGDSFTLFGFSLLLLSIAVGAMSFYWVENPVRKYLNEKW